LIANLDHAPQWLVESGLHSTNYRIFGLIGEVGRIEIAEVVILDPVVEWATGLMIEHGLVDRARKYKPIRETEAACHGKHLHQRRRRAEDLG
jgi:hypothetical protein